MKMLRMKPNVKRDAFEEQLAAAQTLPLWQLNIVEVTGHNLEARGREEVNRLLEEGWRLLHIYTLKYREGETWRERPMGILGRTKASRRPEHSAADSPVELRKTNTPP